MNTLFRPACTLLLLLTLLTGLLYPLAVTALAQLLFPHQASGSLLLSQGKTIGSRLIGQTFDSPAYFWGRLSATTPQAYHAGASSGSNLGPLNPALVKAAQTRIAALKAFVPEHNLPIPVDLVTTSASGLDPDISLAAAYYQVPRIAQQRKLTLAQLEALIRQNTQTPWLGIFGEARVNVLALNLALDSSW